MSFPSITAAETYLNNRIAAESKTRDAMTSAMAKCDDIIIEDLTDAERELLDEAYPSGLAPVPLCLACSAAPALVKAGLLEPISEFDVELELTTRGRRIARRLAA